MQVLREEKGRKIMLIDYGGAYFDDVDGNVIEKEEFDKGDEDFDDYYDDDFDDDYYNDDKEFYDNEVIERERLVDMAMKGDDKNDR